MAVHCIQSKRERNLEIEDTIERESRGNLMTTLPFTCGVCFGAYPSQELLKAHQQKRNHTYAANWSKHIPKSKRQRGRSAASSKPLSSAPLLPPPPQLPRPSSPLSPQPIVAESSSALSQQLASPPLEEQPQPQQETGLLFPPISSLPPPPLFSPLSSSSSSTTASSESYLPPAPEFIAPSGTPRTEESPLSPAEKFYRQEPLPDAPIPALAAETLVCSVCWGLYRSHQALEGHQARRGHRGFHRKPSAPPKGKRDRPSSKSKRTSPSSFPLIDGKAMARGEEAEEGEEAAATCGEAEREIFGDDDLELVVEGEVATNPDVAQQQVAVIDVGTEAQPTGKRPPSPRKRPQPEKPRETGEATDRPAGVRLSPLQKRVTEELTDILRSERQRPPAGQEPEQSGKALPSVPAAARKILATNEKCVVVTVSPHRVHPDAFIFSEVPLPFTCPPKRSHREASPRDPSIPRPCPRNPSPPAPTVASPSSTIPPASASSTSTSPLLAAPLPPPLACLTQRVPKDGATCHLCGERYSDIEEHLETAVHLKRVSNPDTWAEIDTIIQSLKMNQQ